MTARRSGTDAAKWRTSSISRPSAEWSSTLPVNSPAAASLAGSLTPTCDPDSTETDFCATTRSRRTSFTTRSFIRSGEKFATVTPKTTGLAGIQTFDRARTSTGAALMPPASGASTATSTPPRSTSPDETASSAARRSQEVRCMSEAMTSTRRLAAEVASSFAAVATAGRGL